LLNVTTVPRHITAHMESCWKREDRDRSPPTPSRTGPAGSCHRMPFLETNLKSQQNHSSENRSRSIIRLRIIRAESCRRSGGQAARTGATASYTSGTTTARVTTAISRSILLSAPRRAHQGTSHRPGLLGLRRTCEQRPIAAVTELNRASEGGERTPHDLYEAILPGCTNAVER
jgi:hypothetical protein